MKAKLMAGALVLAGTILAGCGGYSYGYVSYGPPPPRYGVVGVAPGPGYMWTDGYWDLRGRNWAWVQGSWVRPPHRNARWERPEWRQEGNGWRFHRGRWR
jgi:hypothetical protein